MLCQLTVSHAVVSVNWDTAENIEIQFEHSVTENLAPMGNVVYVKRKPLLNKEKDNDLKEFPMKNL